MKYPEDLFSISNKTAIITGASRGIGAEIANVFVKSGANVLGISRSSSPQNSRLNKHYQSCNIKDGEDGCIAIPFGKLFLHFCTRFRVTSQPYIEASGIKSNMY